jgi:putative addiction module component (TIGR02574 family)
MCAGAVPCVVRDDLDALASATAIESDATGMPARGGLRARLASVTAEAERLLEAALDLLDSERAELAAILADSIGHGSSDAEIDAAWIAVAKRRLDQIRSGRSETVVWEEVERELEEA